MQNINGLLAISDHLMTTRQYGNLHTQAVEIATH